MIDNCFLVRDNSKEMLHCPQLTKIKSSHPWMTKSSMNFCLPLYGGEVR